MTTFSYTTGDPDDLTAGDQADMNDLKGSFTDIKTFLNGANLDTVNLATSAKPVTLKGEYGETVGAASWIIPASTPAALYMAPANGGNAPGSGNNGAPLLLPISSAQYALSGLTPKLRLHVGVAVNTVAPAVTFVFGLHAVTAVAGSAGNIVVTVNGTAVSGSTVSLVSPTQGGWWSTGSDFAVPSGASGSLWVPCIAVSGTTAVGSAVIGQIMVQLHWV